MSVLLDLPQDLIRSILSEWLKDSTLKTFVRLNIALACHPNVGEYQESLSRSPIAYEIKTPEAFTWLETRKVDVKEVIITKDFVFSVRELVFLSKKRAADLVRRCFNLVNSFCLNSIKLYGNSFFFLLVKGYVLKDLTNLNLCNHGSEDDMRALKHVRRHCRSLQSLLLRSNSSKVAERQPVICDIVDANPDLTSFSVLDLKDCSIFKSLQHCRNLRDIQIRAEAPDLEIVSQFMKNSSVAVVRVMSPYYDYYYQEGENAIFYHHRSSVAHLEVLRFLHFQSVAIIFDINIDALRLVQSHCSTSLLSLDFYSSDKHFESIEFALMHFPDLDHLSIEGNRAEFGTLSTYESFQHSKLSVLSIANTGVYLSDAVTFLKWCPSLQYMHLQETRCTFGYDEFVEFVSISIEGVGREFEFKYVDNDSLELLLQYQNGFSGQLWDSLYSVEPSSDDSSLSSDNDANDLDSNEDSDSDSESDVQPEAKSYVSSASDALSHSSSDTFKNHS